MLDAAGLVADINPNDASSQPTEFAQFNGNLYFTATGTDAGGNFVGRELYQVGPAGSVSLVADINPGSGDSSPSGFTTFNGNLYFAATSGDGRELFKIDTAGLVTQIADINAGVADSSPAGFTPFNGSLYFAATDDDGRELFKLDTSDNVLQVEDILAGPASSDPEGFTEYDGKLYFAATADEGRELFVLNRGDNANQIADINLGPADANPDDLVVFDGSLYFVATSHKGRTLFRQSASGVNPVRVLDPDLLANPAELTVFDGNLYFRADNLEGDSELFFLDTDRDDDDDDDEAIRTVFTTDGDPLGFPSTFTPYNGTLYFAADTDDGRSLFRLDTSYHTIVAVETQLPAGTTVAPGEPAELAEFPLFAGDLYFSAMGPLGSELYRLDPDDNIQLVADINVGPSDSDPADFIVFGNALYFAATTEDLGRELYRVIPSPSTVEIVGDDLVFTDIAGELDNRLVVSSDGTLLRIVDENGHEIASSIPGVTGVGTSEVFIPFANLGGVDRLVVDTRGGDDSLTLDLSSSAASILAQFPAVAFDGGTNNAATRGDVLRLVGDTTTDVTITPDAVTPGAGLATLSEAWLTSKVTFVGLEPVDVSGMHHATLLLPGVYGGNDDLTITDGVDALDGSVAALVVSGSTAGTAIESVHFSENHKLIVDASAGADGNDHVVLSSASSDHANVNLRIDTGRAKTTGNDLVEVTGDVVLAGDLRVLGGRFTLASSVLVGGEVKVTVREDIELFAGAIITASGAGTVRLVADSDYDGKEALHMADGSVVKSQLGEVVLEAGGDVTLGRVITGNDGAEAIRVVARHGDIVDGGDSGGADLVASAPDAVVVLEAGGSVGDSAAGAIDTHVSSIDAFAKTGDIFLNELDDLDGFHLVSLYGLVDLRAGGGLFDGDPYVDLFADRALIVADQIGDAANRIETKVHHLEADAGPGSLWIANDRDLVVGGVSTSLTGISAAQTIALSNKGTLSIVEAIDSAQGPITLSTTHDLTLFSSVTSGGGSIELTGSKDLVLKSTALIDAEQGAAGILLDAGDSIQMADLSLIDGRDGDVMLTAWENITLSDVRTTAQIQVTSGAAILDTSDGGGVDLTASSALLTAVAGIGTSVNPLETTLSQLEADAGAGGLWIDNEGNLQVGALSPTLTGITAGQAISLASAGTLTITEEIDSAQGPITLASTDDLSLSASITSGGGRIEITTGAGIALSATAVIDTEQGSAGILLDAADAIDLADLSLVEGRNGDVALTAGSDVTLGDVRTAAGIQVMAGGAILDTADAGSVDLTSSALELFSALGIGTSSNPLETAVENLEADAGTGGLWLINQGDLEVGNVTPALQGMSAGQLVFLQNFGNLLVSGGATAVQGPLTLTADGTITAAAAVTSGSGFLQIDGTGDLTLTAAGSVEVQQGTAGILLQSGASIGMNDGSLVQGADGAITVQAVGDVTLSDLRTTAQIEVVSGGTILDTDDSSGVDLTAGSALLMAAAGIGTAANPLETTLSQLEAYAGTGGLWLDNQGNVEIGGVSPLFTGITAGQAIVLSTEGTLTITEAIDSDQGPITLTSTDDLVLASSITSGGGRIDLTGGSDITLTPAALIDTQSGAAGISLQANGAIQLDDGSIVQGRDGEIHLDAGGDVILSDLRTSTFVQIESGSAILDTADAAGLDITANQALLIAAVAVGSAANPIETQVSRIEADAGAGGVWLNNVVELTIGGTFAGDNVEIVAAGGIAVVEMLLTGGGNLLLDAAGTIRVLDQITTDGGAVLFDTDGDLLFSADGSIDVVTGSAGITFQVAGQVVMEDGSSVKARDGDVTISAGGSVTLSDLRTTAGVSITSGGAILDTPDGAGVDLTANNASLIAASGVGTEANPMETMLSQLEADAGAGGLWLSNQGDLQVGGVNALLTGIAAAQAIALSNTGPLTITEDVESAQGPITLTATDDTSLSSWLTSGGGRIAISSGEDIILAPTARIDAEGGAAGILLEAIGAIQLADLSLIDGRDGDVKLSAGGDVTLSDVRTTTQIEITSGGAILDTADAGSVDLTASSALLRAVFGIGTSANPLETAVPQLEADAGTGGLWLGNQGNLEIGGVSPLFSGISAGQAITLANAGTLTITEGIDSAQGPITLSSTNDLSLLSSVTSGGGRIEVSSGSDLALSPTALIDTEQGAAGILLDATETIQLADLSLIQGRDGDVTLIAGASITLSDVRTTAGIQVTAGGAIADTNDAGGADLTATTIQLVSALGIGTSVNPLETAVSGLEADAGAGGLWIVNQGSAEVGNVTTTLVGIAAAGAVFLQNAGDLSTSEAVIASQGPLTLTADGALTVAALVTSGSGFLQIDSTGDLSLTATAIVEAQQGAAGMLIESGSAIVMNDGSLVQGADGNIAVIALGNVTLSDLRTTAQVQVTSGGAILDTSDAGGVDLTAGSALLAASSGIGTAPKPLETVVPLLEADAGAGGLWLDNQGDLQIGGVSASFDGITVGDAIAVSTTGTLTVTEAIGGGVGPVVLSSSADFTISSFITSGGGRIELSSAAQIILGAGSQVDVESGAAGVLITGAAGIQMVPGSTVFGRDGDVSLSTGGALILAQITTAVDVSLQAAQVIDANGSLPNVAASGLMIDAASIGQSGAGGAIDTSVDRLTASASIGGIFLMEQDNVFLERLTASADVQLTSSAGTIVVQSVSAGGQATLTAAASINDDGDNITVLAASVLVLNAGQAVGLTGDPPTAQLDTAAGELVVTSTLGFDVANTAADLFLSQAVATSDSAFGRAVNTSGNLLVGSVTLAGADTALHLQTPAGNVLDANAALLNVTATHLGILADQGVGTAADPLDTNVRQVEIHAQSGSVILSNTGTLDVADLPGFVPAAQGVRAFGGVNLFATETIVLAQPVQVTGPGAVIVASNQDISLSSLVSTSAGGAAINAAGNIVASSLTILEVQGGDLQLTADHGGNGAGTIQFFGNIDINGGNAVFNFPAADGLMAGAVSGSGGLVKQGSGTLHLTGTSVNPYTGPTLIQAGTLIVDGRIGSLGPAGTVVVGALTTLSGAGDVNAPIFSAAVTARINSSGNLSLGDGSPAGFDFVGHLLIGDGHFVTLRDSDLAELGITTLLGFGSTLSAPGGVEITSGEQLGGNGLVDGNVFVRTGGQTSPGVSTGILTTRNLDLNAGSTFLVEINGTVPGAGFDQFNVLGDVSVAGAQLAVTGIRFRPSAGTEFVILNNDDMDPVVGQFVNFSGQLLPEGATVTFNGIQTTLSYAGGDSNDVSLTVTEVPLFFVPDSGGETRLVLTANIVAALGLDLEEGNELTAVAALARQTVQAPPNQTVIEFRRDDLQIDIQQSLRIYFKVVNDALMEEWDKEYELPVEHYAENALTEALNFFRRRKFPPGHYRVYIQEPGASEPRILADIHIQEGKIVPPNYREEPGESSSKQSHGNDSDTGIEQNGAGAVERRQQGNEAMPNAPADEDRSPGDEEPHEGSQPGMADSQRESRARALVGAVLAGGSSAALSRERVYAALSDSRHRMSRAARLLRRRGAP